MLHEIECQDYKIGICILIYDLNVEFKQQMHTRELCSIEMYDNTDLYLCKGQRA